MKDMFHKAMGKDQWEDGLVLFPYHAGFLMWQTHGEEW